MDFRRRLNIWLRHRLGKGAEPNWSPNGAPYGGAVLSTPGRRPLGEHLLAERLGAVFGRHFLTEQLWVGHLLAHALVDAL